MRGRVHRCGTGKQSGVVLLVALIALVAVTLAAISLVRSIDTGLVIAGNSAFKQATIAAADVATDTATSWLGANNTATVLNASAAGGGYYANWKSACDMTGNKTPTTNTDDVGWDTTSSYASCQTKAVAATNMPSGYTGSYIITRMCSCDGSAFGTCPDGSDNVCAGLPAPGGYHNTPDYMQRGLTGKEREGMSSNRSPYYRIITRVVGPRDTTSFVETVVTLN